MQMKVMVTSLVLLCTFQYILGAECFTSASPSSSSDCHNRGDTKDDYCCYVEYRTNKDSEYKKLCVNVRKKDVDKGLFEQVMQTIESGNYTSAEWTDEQKNYFLDYSSINEFDCKSNYLTVPFLLLVFFML